MINIKIGDLVSRVQYHPRWNPKNPYCGTVTKLTSDNRYVVYWFDLPSQIDCTYTSVEIERFKERLFIWLSKSS